MAYQLLLEYHVAINLYEGLQMTNTNEFRVKEQSQRFVHHVAWAPLFLDKYFMYPCIQLTSYPVPCSFTDKADLFPMPGGNKLANVVCVISN